VRSPNPTTPAAHLVPDRPLVISLITSGPPVRYANSRNTPTWRCFSGTSKVSTIRPSPGSPAKLTGPQGPFRTWFPEVQAQYTKCRDSLQSQLPNLHGPAPQSSFAASTLNIGPRTVCNPHQDSGNIASGICVDHAFGLFDSTEGGHLVLHKPHLVIRLHPGATVLFPSAVITHENILIHDHEQRMSLTMYSAGGLFRFLEQDSQTKSKWQNQDPDSAALHDSLGESRWAAGWKTFMTIEELYEYWTPRDAKGRETCTLAS